MNLRRADRYRWVVLGTLFFLHAFTSIGQFSIPPLLPFIKKEMGLSYAHVGLITSSYFLGVALTATFGGWAADCLGILRMMVLGAFFSGIFVALAGWVTTFWGIMGFLILAGICYSIITPSTNKATLYWFHERLRATAMGIKQTGINAGGFLASMIIPTFALNLNWHYGFYLAGLMVGLGGLMALVFYRDIDPYHLHQMAFHEWRQQIKKVITNRNVLLLAIEGFFRVGVQNAFLTYLILYLQKILQLPVITASLFFGLAHASGALGRITWGLVSDRIFGGRRKEVYLLIAIISGIGLFIFSLLTTHTPTWLLILIVALLGFTVVGHQGVGLSFIAEVVGKEVAGTASGFNQSFYFFGVVIMAPLFGLLVDLFETYTQAWMVLALFSFLASGFVKYVREGAPKANFIPKSVLK